MGHHHKHSDAGGSGLYRKLGRKIDGLSMRAPWDETFHGILKGLYSVEEADVVVRMPNGLSTLGRVARATGLEKRLLERLLSGLCGKGLVLDIHVNGEFHYAPSPFIIGIFEFTMMRVGTGADSKDISRLFHAYIAGDGSFFPANMGHGEKISIMRALPYEETVRQGDHMEVLDYERAESIVRAADRFSIGLCSCRTERYNVGEKRCEAPLDTCSSFGYAADYLIRNGLAREVSMAGMLENLARSRETGLVLNADNVKRNVTFICHCCGCCCHPLIAISKHGYPNAIVTSNFIAQPDVEVCSGCGKCASACPIGAIEMVSEGSAKPKDIYAPPPLRGGDGGEGDTKKFISKTTQPVIPASEARRESFLKKDSGQAGMTKVYADSGYTNGRINNLEHPLPTTPLNGEATVKRTRGDRPKPVVDNSICLGCGVCALKCRSKAQRLVKRGRRVIHPETTYERIILQSLEKGTLQNQMFDDPASATQAVLRGLVGAFLRLTPVKKALMSDMLRSRFLDAMKEGARRQGQGWALEL